MEKSSIMLADCDLGVDEHASGQTTAAVRTARCSGTCNMLAWQ